MSSESFILLSMESCCSTLTFFLGGGSVGCQCAAITYRDCWCLGQLLERLCFSPFFLVTEEIVKFWGGEGITLRMFPGFSGYFVSAD